MNPRMLTLARESRGLSGTQLAKLAGISQSALSKAENGLTPMTPERVVAVARALGYPVEVLEWPDDPVGLGPASYHHRKQARLTMGDQKRIEAEINLFRMRLRRLQRSVEMEPVYKIPRIDAQDTTPEEAARLVRATWHLPTGPILDMVKTLERAGIVILRRELRSPRISGISTWPPDTLPIVVLNEGMPSDRERFTLAHELGHLVMHEIPTADGEGEADRFAAEFLMPSAEIRPHLTSMSIDKAARLKQHWRVSMSTLVRKALTLDKITPAKYKSLMVQMNQHGYRRSEPVEIPREEPRILDEILKVHRVDHGYSDKELAEVLGLLATEFRNDFGTANQVARERLRVLS